MRLRFSSITEYVLKIWFLNSDLKHLTVAKYTLQDTKQDLK